MTNWNLDPLYTSFDSKAFQNDLKQLHLQIDQMTIWNPDTTKPSETIKNYLIAFESLQLLMDKILRFCELVYTCNTTDPDAQRYMVSIEEKAASLAPTESSFQRYLKETPELDAIIEQDPYLQKHHFVIKELQQQARYLLTTQEEELVALLKSTGSSSWEHLHSQVTSDLIIPFEKEGKIEELPLSEIRGYASSNDSQLRKQAYEAELQAYPAVASQVATALNSIKGEVLTLGKRRGYSTPLEEALIHSRMSKETLEAMMGAIEKRLPLLRTYFKKKAQLLNHSNGLPFYDLFAPVGSLNTKYTPKEAQNIIHTVFSGFSEDLGTFAKNAFNNHWVDWLPHKGKVGGAFCSYSHTIEESRILLNFTGTAEDLTTLAHELGHGYHDAQLKGLSIHNTHYPMPLAETASIFCETLVAHTLLKQLPPEEQQGILELRLQMVGQVLTDIYSRYLFETEVFEKRRQFTLSAEELNTIMLKTQESAYGDGLHPEIRHPYMWVCKPHYYSGSLSYYNFPYAFGLLFATGLYAQYQHKGASFTEDYRKLLRSTGTATVEDVGLMAGLQMKDPVFWNEALMVIEGEINGFLR